MRSGGQPHLVAYDLYWVRRLADIVGERSRANEALRDLLLSMRDLDNDKLTSEFLASAAEHAAGLGAWEAAARLVGAAQALAESVGALFEMGEDPFFVRRMEDARSGLGPDAFDAARRAGSTMTVEDATNLAISQVTEPARAVSCPETQTPRRGSVRYPSCCGASSTAPAAFSAACAARKACLPAGVPQ